MLAARESMTFGKRRYHHAVDSQILQAECRTDNIHNRVNCTDFMEMNLADRDSVCFRLCPRHNLKHPARQVFNTVRCIQTIDDLENVMDVAVDVRMHMIVGVSVIMAVLMFVGVFMSVMMLMVVSVFMIVIMRMVILIMAMVVLIMAMVVLIMAMFVVMMMLFLL